MGLIKTFEAGNDHELRTSQPQNKFSHRDVVVVVVVNDFVIFFLSLKRPSVVLSRKRVSEEGAIENKWPQLPRWWFLLISQKKIRNMYTGFFLLEEVNPFSARARVIREIGFLTLLAKWWGFFHHNSAQRPIFENRLDDPELCHPLWVSMRNFKSLPQGTRAAWWEESCTLFLRTSQICLRLRCP